jgi:hypothetical protein
MWTGMILACGVTACQVFTGPMTESEQQCYESINTGAIYIQMEYPDLRLVDFRCVQWSESL